MHPTVLALAETVRAAGGRALLVGGSVRDMQLGLPCQDYDIEVSGVPMPRLLALLATLGNVKPVGESFGVLNLRLPDGQKLDVSVPRRESRIGAKHTDFLIEPDVDGVMTPAEAARRRDFTINSMAYDPLTGELLDFYGGMDDLRDRVLRPTSDAFAEDALRVLRGAQFAARFGLLSTQAFRNAALACLPAAPLIAIARVWTEWEKLAKAARPGTGLGVLWETEWITLYPELDALDGCPQDPRWHPEGQVLDHTMEVMDAAATIADRDGLGDEDRIVLVLAAMCHDLGKPATTETQPDGRITAHGHAEAGEAPTRALLARIGAPARLIEPVVALVREHMVHTGLAPSDISDRLVRRLARRLGCASVAMLARLVEADMNGRPPLPGGLPPTMGEILRRADTLDVAARPAPAILMGRHLIGLGVAPGRAMGDLLRAAAEAQLDGAFTDLDGALVWAGARMKEETGHGAL